MVRELINANKDLSHRIGERPRRSSSQFYAEKNGKARSASNEMQVAVCEEISFWNQRPVSFSAQFIKHNMSSLIKGKWCRVLQQ